VNIRPERGEDAAAIREVLTAAFSGTSEADLVERLRRDCDVVLSLVADDGGVCGYAGLPRLRVEDTQGTRDVAGLPPVAVMPERQRCGIGSALIREGHRLLAARGIPLVFVVGDPAYYSGFGYSVAAAVGFESAYSGPHFMARRLNESAPRQGKVRYPAAFNQLR
jgi:putative acetyltransferase